jgi:P-type Cu+ transporter
VARNAELIALADASEHPVVQALAAAAKTQVAALPPVEAFANIPGYGVTGLVAGRPVMAGREQLLLTGP